MTDKNHQNIREQRISEIGYAVRTSFALGHAKGKGINPEKGPELDRLILQTAERLNLTEEVTIDDKVTLPKDPDTIIIANTERKYIQAVADNRVWYTSEAILGWDKMWHAVWHSDDKARESMRPECIIDDTWKAETQ